MERIARVKERIREIKGNFKRPARPDAGTRDAVDLRRVATRGAMPVAQMFVIFRFSACHPQATGIGSRRISDVEHEICAISTIIGQSGGQRHGTGHGKAGERQRGGQGKCCEKRFHL